NNFPVDIMVRSGIQKIIGVSFLSIEESNTLHEDIPTVRDQFRYGVLKSKPEYRIPSMVETIMQSTVANSYQKQKQAEKKVDFLIAPDVSEYGLLDWKAFKKVVDIGYREAIKVIEGME
ncbi:MAG: hypothetical protein KJO50_04660, partial [Bacteroidia bacterium]|nr:hypothetical protein [Bacteroidia bacterium]